MWDKRAQLIRIIDADTLEMTLDQGYGDRKDIEVRLLGVYAPEKSKDPEGHARALEFVKGWLDRVDFESDSKWPFIEISTRMKVADKDQRTFTRFVGTVLNETSTRNLNAELSQFLHDNELYGGSGT